MPAALWTGSLSFGLVVIPVRLYPAVRKKAVRFHEIDRGGRRIRHVRVADPEPELDDYVRSAWGRLEQDLQDQAQHLVGAAGRSEVFVFHPPSLDARGAGWPADAVPTADNGPHYLPAPEIDFGALIVGRPHRRMLEQRTAGRPSNGRAPGGRR